MSDQLLLLPVSENMLRDLAAEVKEEAPPPAPSSNGHSGNGVYNHRLIVPRWLQARGLDYREKHQADAKGRRVYVLKNCPFDPSHGDPDSCIMQDVNGKLSAQCFHKSCQTRGWRDFKEAIGQPDGDHYDPPMGRVSRAGTAAKGMRAEEPGKPNEADDDPHRLARVYRDNHLHTGVLALRHWREESYRWDGRAYRVLPDDDLRGELSECIKAEFDCCNIRDIAEWEANGRKASENGKPILRPVAKKVTTRLKADVAGALAGMCALPSTLEHPAWLGDAPFPAGEVLCCKNTLIHLPSWADGQPCLHSLTPSFFSPNALDYDFFEQTAAPEIWLHFLSELWPDDPEAIDTLQEWFGYCLLPDTTLQKILLILGPTRSGKGTIARVLRALIGEDNTAAPTLSSLGTNFGLQPLLGKTLAVVSDARLSGRSDIAAVVERLLAISGEDAQTVDRKNKSAVTTKLLVRFLVISNELPRLNDSSGALVGRLVILRQTRSWYGKEDKTLTRRLLGELPGILLWAMGGWKRLRDRGHFVQPGSSAKLVQEMHDLSSPTGAFLRECCEVAAGYEIQVKELFDRWKLWCDEKGRKEHGTEPVFGRDLRSVVPLLETRQRRTSAGVVRFYEGVRLKQNDMMDEEDPDIYTPF
jgi:putative DNA primase/helicase